MKICGKKHIGMVFVDDPKILRGPLYRDSAISWLGDHPDMCQVPE